MNYESVKKAFIDGQESAFREQIALWVSDETVSNEEFAKQVFELEWNMAVDRIKFLAEFMAQSGVDTAQQDQ